MTLDERRVLAVVPARSGSKGIPDKNMLVVGGMSLIARAGEVLAALDFVDAKVISTDSDRYAQEGEAHGLSAPFRRPEELSRDDTPATAVLQHALAEAERVDGGTFDVILLLEPTSPTRTADDVRAAAELLVSSGADSIVTVSRVDAKFHPDKLLELSDGKLSFHTSAGASIQARQQLAGDFYFRNGCCYALRRECIVERQAIITENTLPLVVEHPVANIDTLDDVRLAEWLLSSSS